MISLAGSRFTVEYKDDDYRVFIKSSYGFKNLQITAIKYCTVGEMEVERVIPELTNDNGKIGLTVRLFEKDNIW